MYWRDIIMKLAVVHTIALNIFKGIVLVQNMLCEMHLL